MAPKLQLTEKLVYTSLREVFVGEDAQVRQPAAIREVIEKHRMKPGVINLLIKGYTVKRIGKIAKVLLEAGVFESDAKAKLRFLDGLENLSTQNNQPTTSEPNIATSDAAPAQHIGVYSPDELLSIRAQLETQNKEEKTKAESQKQSLDIVYLPLSHQHRVLVTVQYVLEKVCFAFAQKFLGGILQREGWDCAEAVELNRWPKVLLTYQKECHLNDLNDLDKPLPTLLNSIVQLRHDAVHRARLSSSKLLQHLTDAVLLARLLQDDVCAESILTIRKKCQHAIEHLVRDKQVLDAKLAKIRFDFAVKRAELERQEADLLKATEKEHKELTASVSESLDRLSDDFGGNHALDTPWKYGYDPALRDAKTSGSRDTAKSKAKEDSKAGPAEGGQKVVAIADQLPMPPMLVPAVNGGTIELTFTGGTNENDEGQVEAPSKAEPDATQPDLNLSDDGSGPKQPSNELSLSQQDVSLTTMSLVEQSEEKPKLATSFVLTDAYLRGECDEGISYEPNISHTSTGERSTEDDDDLPEHDQGSIYGRYASPAPTCVGQTENNAEQGHTKSLVEEDISAGNGAMDPEAIPDQPDATRGQSNALTVIKSWGEGQWPGSFCIKSLDDDPRLTSLPTANEKGRVTLVSMLEDIETAV
ncbi:unnamed protein product [Alternaria alternata]